MDVLGLCSHHWWHKLLAKMYRKKIRLLWCPLSCYHCPWLNVLSTLSSHAHFKLWNASPSAQDDSPFEQGLKLFRPFTWCGIFQNQENSSWDKMTVMYPYYHRSKGHEEWKGPCCARNYTDTVKSCSVLQSTFNVRLRDEGGDSTFHINEATLVRVLGSGLNTPTTYLVTFFTKIIVN